MELYLQRKKQATQHKLSICLKIQYKDHKKNQNKISQPSYNQRGNWPQLAKSTDNLHALPSPTRMK